MTEEPQLAATFEVVAIPTAVLLAGDGRILDRVVGFVEPGHLLERLERAEESLGGRDGRGE